MAAGRKCVLRWPTSARDSAPRFPIMNRLFLLTRLLLAGTLAWGGLPGRAAEEKLVPAEFKPVNDKLGFSWNFLKQGPVSSGAGAAGEKGCLAAAGMLTVNDSPVNFTSARMTPGGREYVFTGELAGITVTRRVRLDARNSVVRFLDVFENKSEDEQGFRVAISTRVAPTARSLVTPQGNVGSSAMGALEAFVAMPATGGAGVVTLLADPAGQQKPQLRRNQATEIVAQFELQIAAGATTALVHYVAQREVPKGTGAAAIKALVEPLIKNGQLQDRGIPKAFRGVIANFAVSPELGELEEPVGEFSLPALEAALEVTGIGRESDGVVLDAGANLSGTVKGGDFGMATAFGITPVAVADVAAVAGGAGVERTVRVFLRNGEVLAGVPEGAKFAMTSDTGLAFAIDLGQVQMLVLRKGAKDGHPPGGTVAFLTTQRGDCLALAADAEAAFTVATPWGTNRIPLAEVESLAAVREPFPSHQMVLADRSRLLVMLAGEELPLLTARFGRVKLASHDVRKLRAVRPVQPAAPPGDDGRGAAERPHGKLVGDYRITGTIDLPSLHLVSAKTVTELDPKKIAKLSFNREAGDEAEAGVAVTLADGGTLSGRLTEAVLPLRSGKCVWQVPLAQLLEVLGAPPEKPKIEEPSAADQPAKTPP